LSCNIDGLRERLVSIAEAELWDDALQPLLSIDMELPISQASWSTLRLVEGLQPFGMANQVPTFVAFGARVRSCRSVGGDGRSLKFTLGDGASVCDAIAFRQDARPQQVPGRIDTAYTLQKNVWNGKESLELVIKDWRPSEEREPSRAEAAP